MFKKAFVLGLFAVFTTYAQAETNIIPRVGVQLGHYSQFGFSNGFAADVSEVTIGGNTGITVQSGPFLADFNLEALQFDASGTDTWRTEVAGTLGFAFYRSAYVIGGYRSASYGDGLMNDDFATMTGPFLGIALAGLQMGDDGKDVFNFSFAVNSNTYETDVSVSDDVGVSLRIAYRRAGSPHSYGIRYQSFGSDEVDEYFTTIGYSYSFF